MREPDCYLTLRGRQDPFLGERSPLRLCRLIEEARMSGARVVLRH